MEVIRTNRDGAAAGTDLLIVGSGAGGMAAAIHASEVGATACVVERADALGGTCVNVGCIPSKYLLEAAHHLHTGRTAFAGIRPGAPDLVWAEVLARKREIIARIRREKYLDVLDAHEGVTVLRGRAELLGGGRVRVGDRVVRAGRVILATGSRPTAPPIFGLPEAGALDSTTAMELERLPSTMIVVGGGRVGLELGQAFSRFGVRVTILEARERILQDEDPDVAATLESALAAEGIEVRTGIELTRVSRDEGGYSIEASRAGGLLRFGAERLLIATGRTANTEGLGLGRAGVDLDARGFIRVDASMRTSNPAVFAAGDVTGGPGFVYLAAFQGRVAAAAALGAPGRDEAVPTHAGPIPAVTFTDPQVASVGMTEEEARRAGLVPDVASLPAEALPRAIVSGRGLGLIKLVAESGTGRLLGAHIVCPNAGDVIGEAVLALRHGLTVPDLTSTLHPYLTWAEGVGLAARAFTRDVRTLSCCA